MFVIKALLKNLSLRKLINLWEMFKNSTVNSEMNMTVNHFLIWKENEIIYIIACVASVSVSFSARARHFSLFGGAKIGASASLFKKRKMLQTCGKPYGNACYAGYLHHSWQIIFHSVISKGLQVAQNKSTISFRNMFYVRKSALYTCYTGHYWFGSHWKH